MTNTAEEHLHKIASNPGQYSPGPVYTEIASELLKLREENRRLRADSDDLTWLDENTTYTCEVDDDVGQSDEPERWMLLHLRDTNGALKALAADDAPISLRTIALVARNAVAR